MFLYVKCRVYPSFSVPEMIQHLQLTDTDKLLIPLNAPPVLQMWKNEVPIDNTVLELY